MFVCRYDFALGKEVAKSACQEDQEETCKKKTNLNIVKTMVTDMIRAKYFPYSLLLTSAKWLSFSGAVFRHLGISFSAVLLLRGVWPKPATESGVSVCWDWISAGLRRQQPPNSMLNFCVHAVEQLFLLIIPETTKMTPAFFSENANWQEGNDSSQISQP